MVTILTNRLVHYRIALYNELARENNIFYTDYFSFNRLIELKTSLDRTKSVILLRDPGIFINWLVLFYCKIRCYKIVVWAGWFTSSIPADYLRMLMSKLADMNVFYSERIRVDFVLKGLNYNKTVSLPNNKFSILNLNLIDRNNIGLIGTLNRRKGFVEFLDSLNARSVEATLNVEIIGDGPLMKSLRNRSYENLNIIFHGELTSIDELSKVLLKCNCIISPMQVGLTVVDSFAHGLPVFTLKDAVTGGEKDSLLSGWNSVVCNTMDELVTSTLEYQRSRGMQKSLMHGAYITHQRFYNWKRYVEQFRI